MSLNKHEKRRVREQYHEERKRFRYGIAVRQKLGAFDKIVADITEERRKSSGVGGINRPNWKDPLWVEELYNAVKHGVYSHQLLRGIVESIDVGFFDNNVIATEKVAITVTQILKKASWPLRFKYGLVYTCSYRVPADTRISVSREPVTDKYVPVGGAQ